MTLASRNRTYRAVAFFSLFFALAMAVFAVRAIAAGALRGFSPEMWFRADGLLRPNVAAALLSAFSMAAISAAASAVVLRKFEKTFASETKYFAFFLACLSLEAVRAALYFFRLQGSFSPLFFALARILIFARIFSAICAFFVAFFSFSHDDRQTDGNLCFGAAVSAAIASFLPINSAKVCQSLSASVGFWGIAAAISAILYAFAAAKLAMNGRESGAVRWRAVAAAFVAMIAGHCILMFANCCAAFLAGFFALCAGMRFFWSQIYRFYLWE